MKRKSIDGIVEQFGRVNHFALSYWLRPVALEVANRMLANIYNNFGVTWNSGRAYIDGQELSIEEVRKLRRRKVSANIYAANIK